MLKKTLMLLLFTGSLLGCGEGERETTEAPEPIIETEVDLEGVNDTTKLSPADTLATPHGTGENI